MSNHEGSFKTNNQGELFMYGKDAFYDYFKQNPSSQFTFKVEKVSNESSKQLNAYFEVEVLPKLIYGFRKTGDNHNKKSIREEIKKYSAVMEGEKDWEDLNYFEKQRCIDELIIFAAQELNVVIENPR